MSCRNNFSYIRLQLHTRSIRSFKIITRTRKVICRRVKDRHCPAKTFITRYLILEVATLHISHQPSCTEASGCDGRCHCATRCTQCVIAFLGTVRAKIVHINIQSNKLILVFFQKHHKKYA